MENRTFDFIIIVAHKAREWRRNSLNAMEHSVGVAQNKLENKFLKPISCVKCSTQYIYSIFRASRCAHWNCTVWEICHIRNENDNV